MADERQDEWDQRVSAGFASDVDDFERVAWPVFRARGYDKNFAMLAYFITVNIVSLTPDEPDEPWRRDGG